jgi:type IV secretion system protein VirB10
MTASDQTPIVPEQPQPTPPLRKRFPLVIALAGIVLLFGLSNLISLITGGKKDNTPRSALPMRPATANPQQVTSFETQQTLAARSDAMERERRQEIADQMHQLQAEQQAITPGPESDGAAPMTSAQRTAIYGNSPNAPKRTSGASQAQAEAKQRALALEKQHQDAINSDTVAIDFAHPTGTAAGHALTAGKQLPSTLGAEPASTGAAAEATGESLASEAPRIQADPDGNGQQQAGIQPVSDHRPKPESKDAAFSRYDFDAYQGRLYRVFEGNVFEGVVTNHIDGGFNGPILIMLTTDYYSHDHQQLLLPQGTRLIGTVQSVNSGQQRKLFAVFHRAVCPDGFSVDFDKFIGLDPLGTTGLATKVSHGYFTAFAAAAAIGGLGGLAQIGNGGIGILGGDPTIAIRNGISQQTGQEAEQILNHFLNRLPVITLKEGSRARVYIGRDLLIPSYADHRVDPTL